MLKFDHVLDTQALLNAPGITPSAPSRRAAIKLSLGAGYAVATLPIMAQTAVKTSADGLTEGEVTIDVAGFKMPAYRAQPAGKTGLPVILVLSEIFGVHEYIADTARRFAKAGYLAIAPELFVRQGDAQSYGEIAKLQAEVISKVPDAQVLADLDAAVAWAAAHGGNTDKLGVTGFCWGGLARAAPRSACRPASGGAACAALPAPRRAWSAADRPVRPGAAAGRPGRPSGRRRRCPVAPPRAVRARAATPPRPAADRP